MKDERKKILKEKKDLQMDRKGLRGGMKRMREREILITKEQKRDDQCDQIRRFIGLWATF